MRDFESMFKNMMSTSVADSQLLGGLGFNNLPTNSMRMNVSEKDNKYIVEMEVPGFKKEEIDISLYGGEMKITAKKEAEDVSEGTNYIRRERYVGTQVRTFTVPNGVEVTDLDASMENGILRIEMPTKKITEEKKPRVVIK